MTTQLSLKDARVRLLKAGATIKQKICIGNVPDNIDKYHIELMRLMDVSLGLVAFLDEFDYSSPVETFAELLNGAVKAYCDAVSQFNKVADALNVEMFCNIRAIGIMDYVTYKKIDTEMVHPCVSGMTNVAKRMIDTVIENQQEYSMDAFKEYAKEFNKFI